jgi:hypothetical protein
LWQCLEVPPENNVIVGERSEHANSDLAATMLFTGVRGSGILRSSLARTCIAPLM